MDEQDVGGEICRAERGIFGAERGAGIDPFGADRSAEERDKEDQGDRQYE